MAPSPGSPAPASAPPSSPLLRLLFALVLLAGAALAARAGGGDARAAGADAIPIEVRTERADGAIRTEVEGTIERPFQTLASVLAEPRHWCQFVPIDPTVRGCLWRAGHEGTVVTLLGGREKTMLPDSSFELPYRFEVRNRSEDVLEVQLSGDEGPMGARDYRMQLRAIRAGEGRTRLAVSTRLTMSTTLRSIATAYFRTLGREKRGFSVVGHDAAGRPRYVGGIQGLIERAAMRHYLALRAYLDSLEVPADERFEASIRRWWQLSQRHPQLEEESRDRYLLEQRREHRSQSLSQNS